MDLPKPNYFSVVNIMQHLKKVAYNERRNHMSKLFLAKEFVLPLFFKSNDKPKPNDFKNYENVNLLNLLYIRQ